MTKSTSVDDTALGTKEEFVKSHVENQDPNIDSGSKENDKTQSNMTIEQNSNKMACKPQLQKVKQEVHVGKQRLTRNRSKILNASSETSTKRDNKKKNTDKEHVVSPNHSITEYFSSLDLKEEKKISDKESSKIVEKVKLRKDSPRSRKTCLPKKVDLGSHKLTEYFAIRKSDRRLKKNADFERQKDLENKIINEVEDGLEIKEFNDKGRGIVTTKEFFKGDFVIEYIGDLIDRNTALEREAKYAKNKNVGCYMYYFRHKDRQYCIDATKESGKLGRLINHSRKGNNLTSRIVEVTGIPHLVLFAKVDIQIGTELLYDYGDRNQESIKNHPWLNL